MASSIVATETFRSHLMDKATHDRRLVPANLHVPLIQTSLSITLDGSQIAFSIFAILAAFHFLERPVAEILISLIPISLFIYNDYQNFLNLGPGGTPSTPLGYLKLSWLRLWALRDPYTAPKGREDFLPSRGILKRGQFPYRCGIRPQVVGIAPQRQIDQTGHVHLYHALRKTIGKIAFDHSKEFGTERSCIEKHGLALFARHPVNTTCQGEICHIHDSDYSMHMALHPEDSKVVLDKGWGQRHPLAWRWGFVKMPVSPDFVMVYAPRGTYELLTISSLPAKSRIDEDELRIVSKIIGAAIWYSLAEEVEVDVCLD